MHRITIKCFDEFTEALNLAKSDNVSKAQIVNLQREEATYLMKLDTGEYRAIMFNYYPFIKSKWVYTTIHTGTLEECLTSIHVWNTGRLNQIMI